MVIILNVFILVALFIEKLAAKGLIPEKKTINYSIINISIILIFPIIVINIFACNPVLSIVVCTLYSIVIMKLVSYHMVNYWCRTRFRYGKPINEKSIKIKDKYVSAQKVNNNLVEYPQNIGLIDIYYFMFAPTLCYQINFPRNEKIRKKFLFMRLIECVSIRLATC